jgi:hypothetical protein
MTVQTKPDFKALENNIIDVIKEEQIKLGYRKETIRLYYPAESISNLLGLELSIKKLPETLSEFCLYVKEHLGNVIFSCKDKRFCIVIPEEGVTYVHEKVEDRFFLRDFIKKISEHNCSIEDILKVFYEYSDNVKYEKMTNGDFDYLIYFKDQKPDSYRYCIKFEDCHTIYHRFTIADYDSFGF